MRKRETASKNVQTAMVYGCRMPANGKFCCQPVAPIENAIHCIEHYQGLCRQKREQLNRHWCLKHGTGECESEKHDYEPINNFQRLSEIGRPSAIYRASGRFELGFHCAACGLKTSAVAREKAEVLGRRDRILRGKRTLEELKELPGMTNADEKLLVVVQEALDTLTRKRRALEKAEDDIMKDVEAILERVGPTALLE